MIHLPTSTDQPRTVLIIGLTGGIGRALGEAFLAEGWRVRALTRHADAGGTAPQSLAGVDYVMGDAMNPADVIRAAVGAQCLVHAANPPRYQRWRELAIPMLANSIEAARQAQARLILPGNLYNYGPDAWPLVGEHSPQHPPTRKGTVRVDMERMLAAAAEKGLRSLVVRAGDFFGAHGPSSWFTTLMIKAGRPLRTVVFPGEPGVGHAWAYLPDLAQAVVRLAQLEERLPPFDTFHFGGHWLPDGAEMLASIQRVAGPPPHRLRVRRPPWALMKLAAPIVPLLREILEMRYLWQIPVRLDNRKLVEAIGAEPHTPLDQAVASSLKQMGCLMENTPTRTALA